MINMVSFAKEKYPETSKSWRFATNSLLTEDNMLAFSATGPVHKVSTHAEVSWRPDIGRGLLSAQYRLATVAFGLAGADIVIPTAQFNVFGLETWLEDGQPLRKRFSLSTTVTRGANIEVLPVPIFCDYRTSDLVLGNADVFMYEKVARIEFAERVAAEGLIG
jgi:hypothetical protein